MQASDRRGTKRTSESTPEPDPKVQNARRLLQNIITVCEVALDRIERAGDTPAYDSEEAFRLVLTLQSVLDRFADAETAKIGVPVQNNVLKSLLEQLLQSSRQMLDRTAIFEPDKLNALVEQLTDNVVVHNTLSELLQLFRDPQSYVGALGERRLLEQIARSSQRKSLSEMVSMKLEEFDRLLEPPVLLAVLRERNQLLLAANFSSESNDAFVYASDVAISNFYFQKNTRLRIRALHASDRYWYAQLYDTDDYRVAWFRFYDKDGQVLHNYRPAYRPGLGLSDYVMPMCERKTDSGRELIVWDYAQSEMHVTGPPTTMYDFNVSESVGNGARGLWIDPQGRNDVVWVQSTYAAVDGGYVLLRQAVDLSVQQLVETRELRLQTENEVIGPLLNEYDSAGRAWIYYAVWSFLVISITCADSVRGTIRWQFELPDRLPSKPDQFSMTFDARGQLWVAVRDQIRCYRVTDTGAGPGPVQYEDYSDDLEPLSPSEQFVPNESGGWTELRTRGDLRLYNSMQARAAAASPEPEFSLQRALEQDE